MNTVIEVKNLIKEYQLPRLQKKNGEVFRAVKGIAFEVYKGEIFGMLGPNGAGKTTTLEIIETIRRPTSGSVTVLGFDVVNDAQEVKNRIGVQLQSSHYLPFLSLKELLELFASFYNRKIDPIELLTFVGLQDKANQEFKNLSGGQQQRFTIATSLVNEPEILFLDEPTTGLDPSARRKMWDLVKALHAKGITIVLTTHYMEEAEFLCDRVAILDQGKIITVNNPNNLIEDLSHTTQVSFLINDNFDENLFKSIPAVEKVYSQKPKVILEVSDINTVGSILELLKNKKVRFSSFTVKTATLEDVYLDLTGKEFES